MSRYLWCLSKSRYVRMHSMRRLYKHSSTVLARLLFRCCQMHMHDLSFGKVVRRRTCNLEWRLPGRLILKRKSLNTAVHVLHCRQILLDRFTWRPGRNMPNRLLLRWGSDGCVMHDVYGRLLLRYYGIERSHWSLRCGQVLPCRLNHA